MKLFGKTFHKEKVDQKKNAKIVNSEDEQEEVCFSYPGITIIQINFILYQCMTWIVLSLGRVKETRKEERLQK